LLNIGNKIGRFPKVLLNLRCVRTHLIKFKAGTTCRLRILLSGNTTIPIQIIFWGIIGIGENCP
tara:strand:+ start:784 stop:975 length:192 start_codon:yes stop_codon:yes gene_type:complete